MEFPPPQKYRDAAAALRRWLRACVICPRRCGADRLSGQRGYCRAGEKAVVNTHQLHHGEEPPISGQGGSGTVFFAGCTMGCIFCQNFEISQTGWGREMEAAELAACFLDLWRRGAHNLNLVTPTPHLPVILEALALSREAGCPLPVVYNTSGYERAATIKKLDGLVEIYLPDYKYTDPAAAGELSDAPDYVENARAALREMHRQVGNLKLDDGVAWRGLLVRHLVLPHDLSGTGQALLDLTDIAGPGVFVSLMSQYYPSHKSHGHPKIGRHLNLVEYGAALQALEKAGIVNGFVQGLASNRGEYLPGFQL